MKVKTVIETLQRNFNLNDDVVIGWWDYEDTMHELGLKGKEKLSQYDFSDLADTLENDLEWSHISENFEVIYDYWKGSDNE